MKGVGLNHTTQHDFGLNVEVKLSMLTVPSKKRISSRIGIMFLANSFFPRQSLNPGRT